ncbi:MAG: NACHT domain-containing protein, partial [Pseudanabaenales cyanobacterium]|nr:NACHT domain-containing protein [Pseudanabaenales cyanobacterium]
MQFLKRRLKGQLFISLLALSLTVSILLGSTIPTYTQTPNQPTPRDEVIEDIKDYAKRHVKTDSSMQTSTVLKVFEDNPVGLAAADIAKIYETEYTRLKEEKESSFWEQVKPNIGWIAAGLLALWVIFQKTLEKWVTNTVENIGEGIYAQLAGSQFFRGIALRRYRNALLKKHKELHIPFRANRPLDMEEVYVPLKVAGSIGRGEIDAYGAINQHRRLMVKGPPGSGKSMLLKHIALTYGAERLNLPDWPVPILLELHRLSDPELTQEKLIQALVDAFHRDNFPKAGRFVQQSLQRGTLILLLDGLDEVNSSVRTKVVQQIKDLLDTYETCRVIITCRTAVYRNEFVSVTEQTLEVVEFSDQQIRRFLRAWEKEMPQDKSIEQLIQTLRNRPRIMALARN